MVKHFIDIDDFKISELKKILIFAKKIKKNPNKYNNSLNSKTLGMIFEKQSTRTRLSFYVGMKKMGGNVIELNKESIGFGKRESKSDIIKVLSAYIDCLVIRNNDHLEIKSLRSLNCLPIINGLSNYSHPCQILSDIFTIEEKLGPINKLKICWVGDINNVLISLIQASKIFKFKLEISAPEHILKKNNALINFPLEGLDLTKYVLGYNSNKYIYDCYGVCNHSGNNLGGHYTSFVKNPNGKWYLYNDTMVTEVKKTQVVSAKAYCLFYRLRE